MLDRGWQFQPFTKLFWKDEARTWIGIFPQCLGQPEGPCGAETTRQPGPRQLEHIAQRAGAEGGQSGRVGLRHRERGQRQR